jgi:hypothetical protein
MIIKYLTVAFGVAAAASAGYGALKVSSPGIAGKIDSMVRDYAFGWDDAACANNPTGCLNARYERLQQLEREVDVSTRAIRGEHERLVQLVSEQEELVAKNDIFLNEGKAQLRKLQSDTASSLIPNDGSVQFAGRTYPNRSTFRAQLELLFEEKTALDASLSSARELRNQLQARLDTLMVQAGQITLAKRMVPAQLQLIRANQTLGEFNTNMDMIDGVIRGSEAGLDQSRQLISTTKDLMAVPAQKGTPGGGKDAFESFLKN